MATSLSHFERVITLPNGWVQAWEFEQALIQCGDALGSAFTNVVIRFPARCQIWIDVVVRLLSFCNQLVVIGSRLRLEFLSGSERLVGYLNRIGFFDFLPAQADVAPARPIFSGAASYRGTNNKLIEIQRFDPDLKAHHDLPPLFGAAVERGCAARGDVKPASNAIANIFSELIGNVIEHSDTKVGSFAALQTYPGGNRVSMAVSDSGTGLLETLRPALIRQGSPLAQLSDVSLLVEIFRIGASSHDDDKRGLGLLSCARSAIRYKADLDVRLARQYVQLRPSKSSYIPDMAYSRDNLPLLGGTHIAFSLDLA